MCTSVLLRTINIYLCKFNIFLFICFNLQNCFYKNNLFSLRNLSSTSNQITEFPYYVDISSFVFFSLLEMLFKHLIVGVVLFRRIRALIIIVKFYYLNNRSHHRQSLLVTDAFWNFFQISSWSFISLFKILCMEGIADLENLFP